MYTIFFGDDIELYNHVLDGTWTHDVFAEYCKAVYTDLNGNGQPDIGDLFGFEYEEWGIPNFLSMSTGLTFSKRDADGLPVVDLFTEQSVFWGETLYKLLYTENISILGNKNLSFLNEKNLFVGTTLGSTNSIRESSFEYGILPYPKLYEYLDYMSGAATANGNAMAIPVSALPKKLEAACAALESLCADAYRNVVPVWYEIALKIKYADADIDAQMVDIIYKQINVPFIMMSSRETGGLGSIFTLAALGERTNGAFASYYEKNKDSIMTRWDKMIETYLSIDQ